MAINNRDINYNQLLEEAITQLQELVINSDDIDFDNQINALKKALADKLATPKQKLTAIKTFGDACHKKALSWSDSLCPLSIQRTIDCVVSMAKETLYSYNYPSSFWKACSKPEIVKNYGTRSLLSEIMKGNADIPASPGKKTGP